MFNTRNKSGISAHPFIILYNYYIAIFFCQLFLIASFLLGLILWIDIQVSTLPNLANQTDKFHTALYVYPVSLIAAVLVTTLAKCCIFLVPIRANYKLHNKMVSCLLQVPSHFYAVNPPGRILNRLSQDINNLDDLLPFYLVNFFHDAALAPGAIILCLISNILLTPLIIITIIICFGLSKLFFNSAMDIKRLMSQAGSPLYSHFSNTMEGLRIIRVHNREKEFTKVLLRYGINYNGINGCHAIILTI
jgi:ABC-type multidrug transport system fused ATPase/permease subunit